jgi:AbrB family looped-hinge helix DNA binding protein
MLLSTLTAKGQMTIPKHIRDAMKLRPGDKVEIVLNENQEAVIRPAARKVDEVFCKLHKPGRQPATLAEMDAAVSQRMKERFK